MGELGSATVQVWARHDAEKRDLQAREREHQLRMQDLELDMIKAKYRPLPEPWLLPAIRRIWGRIAGKGECDELGRDRRVETSAV